MEASTTAPPQEEPQTETAGGGEPPEQQPPAPPEAPEAIKQPTVVHEDHRGEDVPEHLKAQAQPKPSDTSGDAKDEPKDAIAELEKLDPIADEVIRIIGKPPEKGGKDDEWARYYQRPLGHFARMRFFGLVSTTIKKALQEGQTMEDLFGQVADFRGRKLTREDIMDAGEIMPVILSLIAAAPDFLLEAYCILLEIPSRGGQRVWAKEVMEQPYLPERELWGMTDDTSVDIIETCIEQNWDPIVEFFTGKLPRVGARVRAKGVDLGSTSAQ